MASKSRRVGRMVKHLTTALEANMNEKSVLDVNALAEYMDDTGWMRFGIIPYGETALDAAQQAPAGTVLTDKEHGLYRCRGRGVWQKLNTLDETPPVVDAADLAFLAPLTIIAVPGAGE